VLYVDYDWDVTPEKIILDESINIDRLGWKNGDYFQVQNINGQAILVKVDPLVKFINDGKNIGSE
jgi:hypothetical protein